jgi:anti-sigma factor RsiW
VTCDAARRLLGVYVDGELVGDERAAVEAHVAECPRCAADLRHERALLDAVRAAHPDEPAPESTRLRVEALFATTASATRGTWRGRRLALAATALLALGAAIAWRAWIATAPSSTHAIAAEFVGLAADSHLRFERGQLPLEVSSERPEQVSRWFDGRVPFRLELPDYPVGPGERKFYRLIGGRLVSFRGDYAAYVVYRLDDERPISLLVASASRVEPSGGKVVRSGALRFHVGPVAGLNVISWSDKGLTYALASDHSVGGSRSCMVCHGAPEERSRIEGFGGST